MMKIPHMNAIAFIHSTRSWMGRYFWLMYDARGQNCRVFIEKGNGMG